MSINTLSAWIFVCMPAVLRDQNCVTNPLELKLQTGVSSYVGAEV